MEKNDETDELQIKNNIIKIIFCARLTVKICTKNINYSLLMKNLDEMNN